MASPRVSAPTQVVADKPSFLRGLFSGAVHDELIFPYPAPLDRRDPEEALTVTKLIRDLRALNGDVIDAARFDEEERVSEEAIRALAEIGMLGITIPREYGGLELSSTGYARVFSELSRIDPSCAVLVGVHCGLGSKAIVLYGSDAQKQRYLPPLARGDFLAAYALTEPETGSDAQNIRTRAELSSHGLEWVLTGRKLWIGNGHRAGVIATFAQTGIERRGQRTSRPTAFLIRPDMPGFRVVGTVRKLGIRGSTQAELAFEGLRVPHDHMLGQAGKGFAVAVHVLNGGRLTLAAGCTGGSKELVNEMARYAEQRVQFGRPIAGFEITQRKMAQLAADVYASDAMLGVLASLVDRGEADVALEAACAKVFASDLIWRAADEMVQVAGGRGFVKPYPYERLLRDARINRIFEGTNEVLRLFIALNGIQGPAEKLKELGSALRSPLRNLGLISGYAASRVKSAITASDRLEQELHERLEGHRKFFEKHVTELHQAAERAVTRHRKEIIERQMVLERLADMAILLFATVSVLARTQQLIEERGVKRCERELELCDLFCVEAGLRFREHRHMLDSAPYDARRAVAARVRSDEGYGVEDALLEIPAKS